MAHVNEDGEVVGAAWRLDPEFSESDLVLHVTNNVTKAKKTYHVHRFVFKFMNIDGMHSQYFARVLGPDSFGKFVKDSYAFTLDTEEAEAFPALLDVLYLGFEGAKLGNPPPEVAIALIKHADYFGVSILVEKMGNLVLEALNNLAEDGIETLVGYLPSIVKNKAVAPIADKIYPLAVHLTADALLCGEDMADRLRDVKIDVGPFSRDVVVVLDRLLEVPGNQPALTRRAAIHTLKLHESAGIFEATPLVVACLGSVDFDASDLPEMFRALEVPPAKNIEGVQNPADYYLEVQSTNPKVAGRYNHKPHKRLFGDEGFNYVKEDVEIGNRNGYLQVCGIEDGWELRFSTGPSFAVVAYKAAADHGAGRFPPSWGWKPSTATVRNVGGQEFHEPMFENNEGTKKRAFEGFPPIFVKLCEVGAAAADEPVAADEPLAEA